MGQAKLRINKIGVLKNFDNIVDDFVRRRQAQNRYGGGIFRANNVKRLNTGRYNKCVDNAEKYRNDHTASATGWILCYNDYSNDIEVVPHVWNIDFKNDIMFDSTPFHELLKHYAYVWDSDMYGYICEHGRDKEGIRTLPGVAYIKYNILGNKLYKVIDKCPDTGHVIKDELMTSCDIADFNWDYEYVNPY